MHQQSSSLPNPYKHAIFKYNLLLRSLTSVHIWQLSAMVLHSSCHVHQEETSVDKDSY